jgi:hypothetical protein
MVRDTTGTRNVVSAEPRRIGDDLGQVVGDVVVEDRLQSERRRNVVARRPGADAALLLPRHVPLQIELGRVRMRRVLEDRAQLSPDRQRVAHRERRLDRLALALLDHRVMQHHVEGGDALAGGYAAHDAEMALDEFRLVRHVAVHECPAVCLHDGVESEQGGIVIVRIGGDQLAAKLGLEKIARRPRRLLAGKQPGVVGRRDREHVDRRIAAVGIAEARIERLEALHLERQQHTLALPADEFLHRLEGHEIDLELIRRDLLVDRGREAAGIAAGQVDLDAGKARLVFLDPALVEPGGPPAIDRERPLVFRLGVDLVERFGVHW